MVKDHSDNERKPTATTLQDTLFITNKQVILYMHHPTDRIVHTTTFDTSVVENWLEQEIIQ